MAHRETLSPNGFSLSVHNATSGLFSIWRKDRLPSIVLSAADATIEAGFLEAWSALTVGDADRVLVVYHDEPLPAAYGDQVSGIEVSTALGVLLELPENVKTSPKLQLRWHATEIDTESGNHGKSSNLEIIKLLTCQKEQVVINSERMTWVWNYLQ